MANTFLTPSIVADVALLALENNLVLGNLVYRGYDKEFRKIGDTAKIRKPATFTAIEFDGDLTGEFEAITEQSVDVKLDKILVVPFEITQKEMSLDVKDLTSQVIEPAARALAQKVDELLAGLYADVTNSVNVSATPAVGDIADVRKKLNDSKAPFEPRYGVLSPQTEAKYIVLDAFMHAEKKGDTETVRQGSLGRVFGIEFYMDQNIRQAGTPANYQNLIFHKNAFCLATAPLAEPLGGANASVREHNGLSMQVVLSWNHNTMKNVGTMAILCGVKTLQPELACKLVDPVG